MAAIHIGTTVLWRYPTPKGRNPPSSVYNNCGFAKWIAENNIKNIKIAIWTLYTRTICFNIVILCICFFYHYILYIMPASRRKTCKIYKSCAHVPCRKVMNHCSPAYCSDGSKNWSLCNMGQWNPRYRKYCKSESRCRKSRKNTISTDQVDAKELHRKMPYIWRHLDRKTRRKMVTLARKPVSELDIKYTKP
jgi:hypothetical protein